MRKIFLATFCLLVLSAPLFADMSKAELQNMYLEYFRSQNIQATVDSDGDVAFQYTSTKFNDLAFIVYIIIVENDQQYFRISTFNFYSLDNETERTQASIVAALVTGYANVAKIYVQDDGTNMIAAAEGLVATPQDFRTIFPKLVQELDNIIYYFVSEM